MTRETSQNSILDQPMNQVFDNSSDTETMRSFLWNYFMEQAGNDSVAAETAMLPLLQKSDQEIIAFADEQLKK
ncbi:hypothetical protein OZX56_02530 [Lactobacillus sp. ESL0684]|uniref:P8 family protein n=1 Tax=Lactobacillus sp. ESL0684 TaxID=2983213 RepID=UPI0023F8FB51|nr:hypothetical protein [Lactobacillus sp. ESL0684]WEV44122.1 hypothetical protein OZX56_02530 [Lactobacillus sp. ESL0684]